MDWNKASALGTFACLVVAIIALILQAGSVDNRWAVPLLLIAALLGVVLLAGIRAWKSFTKMRTLPLRILGSQCGHILGEYRKLAFDFPEVARLPLNRASRPEFGDVWDHTHITMFRLKYELYSLLFCADMAWEGRDYKPSSLLQEEQTLVIVDLISGLERLLVALDEKSK
jgi:hypothetical protein